MSFESNIKEWVKIDDQLKLLQQKQKELREKRNELNDVINTYIETNHLNNSIIQISDGSLKYNSNKTTQPLTFRFVRECLSNCISNQESVDQLMNYIKEHRESKINYELKRYYKK
jgi:hypothetical protein